MNLSKKLILAVMLLTCLTAFAYAEEIQVTKNGTKDSIKATQEHFTGDVRVDMLYRNTGDFRSYAGTVTFEPGARTDWHSHTVGQVLIVLSGKGYVQKYGSPAQEIMSGDVVWIPAGIKHWHGAADNVSMAHIAIVESKDGVSTNWHEKVTDTQYKTK